MPDATRWVVSGLTFATLYYRRDAETAIFVLGALLNALLCKVLKRVFNSARPAGARLADPGMPSSHASSLFFFAAYLGLATHRSTARPEWLGHTPAAAVETLRLLLALGLPAVAFALSLVRVRDGLHSFRQVLAGAATGGLCGKAWLEHAAAPLQARLGGRGAWASDGALAALCVAGLLLVGSAERVLAAKLKRG